ncbi:response regulator [Paenibacillus rigui]|uniref:DNA-binding response regulator n=1 Tax=Paenibacillus rigui TaxID=554312 RepID=A0A229ULL7_9BACL|nr:response regulator [Paenibacillus rigui]OXM84367.1 DNA-binding response regulator [Paenibacillus rigui]
MWTVLLVEDEVFVRESVQRIMDWEAMGFTVIGEAGDGQEAFEFICAHRPDVVISDIIMPKMNGVELLQKVRETGISSRFVMLSCMSDFEYVRQAMEYGASNYILKLSMKVQSLKDALEKVKKELELAPRTASVQAHTVTEGAAAAMEQKAPGYEPTDHPEINKILAYLHEHYQEEISLSFLAQYVAMDVKYISQLFKKKTGDTFVHYLHRIRIERACELLIQTNTSVSEIGEKVGFVNDNYFIKIFKRFCHMTPQHYRKLQRDA